MNWLTRIKLSRLERSGTQCLGVLAESDVSYRPVSDREDRDGCGLSNAVAVTEASRALSGDFTASCPLAVAWALADSAVPDLVAQFTA